MCHVRQIILMLLSGLGVAVACAQTSPHGPVRFACRACHLAGTMKIRSDSAFNHALTGYILNTKHERMECGACHREKRFSLQETDCIACHADVHAQQFGETCARCHVTQAWLGADMMRQHEKGRFLLTGAHEAVPCKQCHVGGEFTLVFRSCRQCHEELASKVKSPDHSLAAFDRECGDCHSTGGWHQHVFDHTTTRFPLAGVHAQLSCSSCHMNDNYQLRYVDCFACHEHQFKQSLNPNHIVGNFPHDCAPCHSPAGWRPSTFAHDQLNFPIFRGKHRSQWTACSDCHQNTANFTYYTCLTCHNESATSQSHGSVVGYSYASPACYNCHRDV